MSETEVHPRLNILRVGKMAIVGIAMFCLGFLLRGLMRDSETKIQLLSPLSNIAVEKKKENPYGVYSFESLRTMAFQPGAITLHQLLETTPTHNAYLVSWEVPDPTGNTTKKVSGQINIPTGTGPFPVIIMLRGYVDPGQYTTGVGTRNGAAAFARNGYITIAPDFLGYGTSDLESNDVLIARFAKPLVVLQLLRNLQDLDLKIDPASSPDGQAVPAFLESDTRQLFNTQRLGLWGHSNGGQIALSVLEITSRNMPTSLWAPVSKPFPYSALYYMDESPDQGAYVREALAKFEFELKNNPWDFSILKEPARILSPVQIHQGGADDAVPLEWSQELEKTLKDATVSATLFTYPQANHNLTPDWDTVVQRDLQFYAKYLK